MCQKDLGSQLVCEGVETTERSATCSTASGVTRSKVTYGRTAAGSCAKLESNQLGRWERRVSGQQPEPDDLLSKTLDELRLTQSKLLQAQKLEAVGQLAAGIAHELNTPAQYVGDNVSFLQRAFDKLLKLVEAQNSWWKPRAPAT